LSGARARQHATMRPLAKGALTLAIVGGLVGLVIAAKPGSGPAALRPGADGPPSKPRTHRPEHVASSPPPPSDPAPTAQTSATGATSAPASIDSAWREHGKTAVVRSENELDSPPTGLLAIQAPARWDEPRALKFFHLKKHYRAHRKQRRFEPATAAELSGAAVKMTGAFMPIDPIPDDGRVKRFWLANPVVVMAGCVFCTPPTMADLVYVTTGDEPLEVDREILFRSVLMLELLGRLRLGPHQSSDGVQYLFAMELRKRLD